MASFAESTVRPQENASALVQRHRDLLGVHVHRADDGGTRMASLATTVSVLERQSLDRDEALRRVSGQLQRQEDQRREVEENRELLRTEYEAVQQTLVQRQQLLRASEHATAKALTDAAELQDIVKAREAELVQLQHALQESEHQRSQDVEVRSYPSVILQGPNQKKH